MTILDGDVVDITNKNRQLPALSSTVGRPKAEVVAARLADINPQLRLDVRQVGRTHTAAPSPPPVLGPRCVA
jgi:tRNA A37 threonylcarbamoyladenosine dehydratase